MSKDILSISIPSKTFILGEYLALRGGPALLATTEPRFEYHFEFNNKTGGVALPFHPQSPAGKLWKKHEKSFQNCHLERSTHQLGAGSSTADFLAVYFTSLEPNQRTRLLERNTEEYQQMQLVYQELAAGSAGPKPSGLDLLAQTLGGAAQGLVWVDWRTDTKAGHSPTIELWRLPPDDVGFILVKTGVKLATHQHLQSMRQITDTEWTEMSSIMSTLTNKDSKNLIPAIRSYAKQLKKMNMVAPSTLELLAKWDAIPELAAKGCGAMGADLIAIVYPKYLESKVRLELGSDGVVFASHESLSQGLDIQRPKI